MTRAKPGEGITQRLVAREKKAKATLARIEEQRHQARDKVTGKTKAQAYVKTWLEKLTATELRHECAIRGYLYEDFETMEQAMNTVRAAMFSGVAARMTCSLEDAEAKIPGMTCGPVSAPDYGDAIPMTYQASPEDGEHADGVVVGPPVEGREGHPIISQQG